NPAICCAVSCAFDQDVSFLQKSLNQPDHRAPVNPGLLGQLGVPDLYHPAFLWRLRLTSPKNVVNLLLAMRERVLCVMDAVDPGPAEEAIGTLSDPHLWDG